MIILASSSPRRIEMLRRTGANIFVVPPNDDETYPENLPPEQIAVLLAERKAQSVGVKYPTCTVIGADTIVVNNKGEIFGKPKNNFDAMKMLKCYSDTYHDVITGVAIVKNGELQSFFSKTRVWFRSMNEHEIMDYIATEEPIDKAGAYAVQGLASLYIEKIEGDYNNIVGLPLCELCKRLNIKIKFK